MKHILLSFFQYHFKSNYKGAPVLPILHYVSHKKHTFHDHDIKHIFHIINNSAIADPSSLNMPWPVGSVPSSGILVVSRLSKYRVYSVFIVTEGLVNCSLDKSCAYDHTVLVVISVVSCGVSFSVMAVGSGLSALI